MLNFRKKFFLIPILFLVVFFNLNSYGKNDNLVNLALNSSISCKGYNKKEFPPSNMIDGNFHTRWSAGDNQDQLENNVIGECCYPNWVKLDLKNIYLVENIELIWETPGAYGTEYKISYSKDNKNYYLLKHETSGIGGNESISFLGKKARYIKIDILKGTYGGPSIFEIRVLKGQTKQEYLKQKYNDDYNAILSYANSGNYSQAISSFYYVKKASPYYKELSKKVITWKSLQAKKATDEKLRSDLTTAESYASSNQYNQAIHYAQQVSKKNPYYKQAQNSILQWKDAILNMSNNSNNNSNTYTPLQKDNSAEEGKKNREQMQKNCIATCKSALSICKSNAQLLSNEDGSGTRYSSREKALGKCESDYFSCQYSCKY